MGFRTVVVSSRCKLEYRLNYLVVRGECERKVHINEINTLIVQSTAVSLTAALLCELAKNNVKVIFCDEKCNPQTELLPYYGAHNTSKRYKQQIKWDECLKREIWTVIIRQKIINQADVLNAKGFSEEYNALMNYAKNVEEGDITNREGHAAKIYFNRMMPQGRTRRDGGFINCCLNYGYSVLLSAFNREIVASGYLTQLGIWHDNEFNQFNLSCDLMEPLRTVVDCTAFSLPDGDVDFKKKMANILNYRCIFAKKSTTLDVAVRLYVKGILNALDNGEIKDVEFPKDIIIDNEL